MGRALRLTTVTLAVLMLGMSAPRADEGDSTITPAQRAAFDQRLFAAEVGTKTAYACFTRRYDAEHLARHPQQKVREMKLLVSAEKPPEEAALTYSFRLGFKYRQRRSETFDSSGSCRHAVVQDSGNDMRLGCSVDCDGGRIDIALAKDDQATLVRVERIRIWQHNKPDEDASGDLVGGTDDRIFRLDRVDTRACASLVTDRQELAALRHK